MKRTYTKPNMKIERFAANAFVADCTRLVEGYEYTKTQVDCVVSSYDIIFTSTSSGCDHVVNTSGSGSGYMWVTYNGTLYFCWVSSSSSGSSSGSNMTLLEAILAAGGVTSTMADGGVWHAGPATDYLKTIYSHS